MVLDFTFLMEKIMEERTPSEKLRYIKGRSLTWGDVGRKLGFKESTMRAYVSKPERIAKCAMKLIDTAYNKQLTKETK